MPLTLTTWEIIGLVAAAVAATGGAVFTVMLKYYGDRGRLAESFKQALRETAASLKESLKAAHERVDRIEDRHLKSERVLRSEMRDMIRDHETRMERQLTAATQRIETIIRNGGGR